MVLTFPFYRINFSSNFYYVFAFTFSNNSVLPNVVGYNTLIDANTYFNNAIQNFATVLAQNGIENVRIGYVEDNTDYVVQKVTCDVSQGSSSCDIDYTEILTSINTNLTNLNSNINTNYSNLIKKLTFEGSHLDDNKILERIVRCLCEVSSDITAQPINAYLRRLFALGGGSSSASNSTLQNSSFINDISRKIFNNSVSDINNSSLSQSDLCSRIHFLVQSFMKAASNNSSSIISNSLIKDISDKLANSNDLHTISQAIDLISTAIAQTPTTDTTNLEKGLNDIKTAVENKDNLLLIDGTQNFEFRKRGDEYDA